MKKNEIKKFKLDRFILINKFVRTKSITIN